MIRSGRVNTLENATFAERANLGVLCGCVVLNALVSFWFRCRAELVDDALGRRTPGEAALVFLNFDDLEFPKFFPFLEVVVHTS